MIYGHHTRHAHSSSARAQDAWIMNHESLPSIHSSLRLPFYQLLLQEVSECPTTPLDARSPSLLIPSLFYPFYPFHIFPFPSSPPSILLSLLYTFRTLYCSRPSFYLFPFLLWFIFNNNNSIAFSVYVEPGKYINIIKNIFKLLNIYNNFILQSYYKYFRIYIYIPKLL